MGGVIWNVENPTGRTVLYTLFGFGWGLVLVSTFVINHFDLFGLRQVWLRIELQLMPGAASSVQASHMM